VTKIKECVVHVQTTNVAFNTLLCSLLFNKFYESNSSITVKKKLFKLVPGPFVAPLSHEWTTMFPPPDREHIIGKYKFIHAVMYYIL
jgi:hypothetical protein